MAGADKPYDKNVRITMRKILLLTPFLFAAVAFAFEDPIELWANAVGGREKVAAIKSIYREATLEFGNYQGAIKVWHTADGKYRKEEQIATVSVVEIFDGVNGTIQQGAEPPHRMDGAELKLAASK